MLIKRNYYYLVAGLPNLIIDGNKPLETSLAFKKEMEEHLHLKDYELIKLLYLQYDNKNVLNLLLKQGYAHTPIANYPLEYLEEQIKQPTDIIDYLKRFIEMFNKEAFDKSNLNCEKQLQSLYYDYVLQAKNDFLKQWFSFEYNIKNILTAINCHKFGFDIEKQLITTIDNNEVYEILLKGSPKAAMFTDQVPFANKIVKIATSEMSISEKEKVLDNIKWEFIDEHTSPYYFSIEKILGFIMKVNIVERWQSLDNETGKAFFEKLINEMKNNYKFTDEFSIKSKTPKH